MTLSRLAARPFGLVRKHLVALAGTLVTAAALAAPPIEIVVPFGPGSGADSLARHSAPALQAALGTTVEVKNLPGATGLVGMSRLLSAPSDGRTIAVLTADTYATLAFANARWKASDIIPLGIMMRQPSMLFVATTSRFAKWQDLEKEARSRPRALRVAVTGFGSPDYIALQQLAAKNVELTPVPQSSPDERYRAVVEDRADAIYEQLGDVRSLVEAGKLRPILMFSNVLRAPGALGVPTSREVGLGDGLPQFRAFVVKAGTDPAVVARLASALERMSTSPQYKAFLENQLADSESFIGFNGARAFLDRELVRMKQTVDALPMHAQYMFDELKESFADLPAQF